MGFELPEILKVSKQMEDILIGKKIDDIILAEQSRSILKQGMSNLDNRQNDILNSTIKKIAPKGKWIFLEFENNNFLMFGEIIGKFLYFEKGKSLPQKFHVLFQFDDGTSLTFQSSLYAFLTVATEEEKNLHKYAGRIGLSPNEKDFTLDYFNRILVQNEKKPIKALLNLQDQISGLGNAYINDILFEAQIHPKRKVSDINQLEKGNLYNSIVKIVTTAIELGGSIGEYDLYGNPGKYSRIMDKNTPICIKCGEKIVKENVLGSSSYYCPNCQKI
jgi:formamidopyrimidine-DNA glycosylase